MFIEKICVATDGSDLAVRAAQMAVLLGRTGGGRVVACSVAQPHFSMAADAIDAAAVQAELQRALGAAHAHVRTVAHIAQSAGVACEEIVRIGSAPGPEIVRVAEEQGCDLIVMGAHGPHDMNKAANKAANKAYAGSAAQHVLACSTIPALVYRDPREASPPEFSDEDAAAPASG